MKWAVYQGNKYVQVVPVGDLIKHKLSPRCPCKPRVFDHDPETGRKIERLLIVHRAIDGREMIEDGERIINEPRD